MKRRQFMKLIGRSRGSMAARGERTAIFKQAGADSTLYPAGPI
jgi:hypothetical protein